MRARLTFEIPGRVPSNNRVARRVGNKTLKSAEARVYQARVSSYALHAKALRQARWEQPAICRVEIVAWNTRLDVDNIPKCILDGMAGVVYENDKSVRQMLVTKETDKGEQRVEVTVTAIA